MFAIFKFAKCLSVIYHVIVHLLYIIVMMAFSNVMFAVIFFWINDLRVTYLQGQVESYCMSMKNFIAYWNSIIFMILLPSYTHSNIYPSPIK